MNMAIMPERRNLSFKLAKNKVNRWNGNGLHFSQFLNTLSLFFPAGERFFIDSVRNYRNDITDQALKDAVKAFIGQEGLHSREHIEYNQAIADGGVPIERYEQFVATRLKQLKQSAPKDVQLAITCALEHLTAVMAKTLMEHEHVLEGSDERYKALWQWHALEETEHKGVAFDVYEQVVGTGTYAYTLRTSSFVVANIVFWAMVIPFHISFVKSNKGLFDLKGWRHCNKVLWGKKRGAFRAVLPEWFSYFKPGFHPWDDDNRYLLEQADDIVEQVNLFA